MSHNCDCRCGELTMLPVRGFGLAVDTSGLAGGECACGALLPPSDLYVATTGNDANNGTSWEKPFASVQAAVDATSAYLAGGRPITIHIAPGRYEGDITIMGDTHHPRLRLAASTTQAPTLAGNCYVQTSTVFFNGLHFESDYYAIRAYAGANITVDACSFTLLTAQPNTGSAIYTVGNASCLVKGVVSIECRNYCVAALMATAKGLIQIMDTVIVNGTVAWATFWTNSGGTIHCNNLSTVTGTVTGRKYLAYCGGIIRVLQGKTLPGSQDGLLQNGGIYGDGS